MIYDHIDLKDKLYQWLSYDVLPDEFGEPLIPRGAGVLDQTIEDYKKSSEVHRKHLKESYEKQKQKILDEWKNQKPDENGNKPPKPEFKDFDDTIEGSKFDDKQNQAYQELQSMTNDMKDRVYTNSFMNKLYLITLDGTPYDQTGYKNSGIKEAKTFTDLCMDESGIPGLNYDADDFLYASKLGSSLNRMITLRRFPYACTDNIWEPLSVNNMGGENPKIAQEEQDICRMVTYYNDEVNRLEDILSFSYGLRWRNLQAGMEANRMVGEQEGLSGFMNKVATVAGDEDLIRNRIMGENQLEVDPTFDQNKVHGPVDVVNETHIRDIGFDFQKEFDIVFEYSARSYGTRSPEYAMKDILANILACTYNDGDFWGGARYWTGRRPSRAMSKYKWMSNSKTIDDIFNGAYSTLRAAIQSWQSDPKGSALNLLKNIIKGSVGAALGKILDAVGRPGIIISNSLLSGEPVGEWHLTIGNPYNPILSMGDLICTNVQITFPTDTLSYGEFPTSLSATVSLKPSKPRDRAGIEMMFNHGKHRMYWAPKKVSSTRNVKGTVSHYERKDISLAGYQGRFFDGKNFHVTRAMDYHITSAFKYCDNRIKVVTDRIFPEATKLYRTVAGATSDAADYVVDKTNQAIHDPQVQEYSNNAKELLESVTEDVKNGVSQGFSATKEGVNKGATYIKNKTGL